MTRYYIRKQYFGKSVVWLVLDCQINNNEEDMKTICEFNTKKSAIKFCNWMNTTKLHWNGIGCMEIIYRKETSDYTLKFK